ncbi:MAG TPA: phenylalanine--tRNA ligase subunit beta [Amaricoccus sp.]|uniref:phenylalanine--tRNA ligase subunit beta n=1 Tax=Amaricoccus sp. TaxID=1872485 RepID=UPI002C0799D3|nr:phenylalanine--tRNA ligase subunit beta [Amaricoccus sp.]HMQ94600.1 phenylalanine--tRNA ligase subunit beta [Amaricoccus sp.]HMR52448.1 phenylalanine--tRNA ligase subunit beta [Amaricoccus sp.]HMR61399.1 phenylalanine--tRNA ligase subunit beta [Amaricoccus sp.]HMT99396.1 phenylalanine--tRNA ligase subunit beta [Amaricoccus sp.]
MKFTLAWLKEHLDTDATLDAITFALTDLGLEVESVTNPAARLAAFTVGEVIEAGPHPDADKLRVCRVATAAGEKQIVCGAPNARAGIKVVVAAPGDYIPGIDTTIKVGRIRGVESQGMMLSEREMELSDEHDGIVELDPSAEVGARYIDVVPFDPVIDIAVTPNRPDALAVSGIARDLAARGMGRLRTPAVEPVEGAEPCPIGVYLAPDVAGEACPLFAGRLIRGVKNGPSPQWLQDRLRAIGLRPISALVDITNFVTYDRGRPLHVFDADKLHGAITVRLARPGEHLPALDGKTYAFDGSETLVCDEQGPEAIGGVIGGLRTGCTAETVNVFIESAWFDPHRTARTGRRLRINSDARYRFERGVDPAFTPLGVELAARMILDLCGGTASEVMVAGAVPRTARSYPLDPAHVERLVGMEIPRGEQIRILSALGFAPEGEGATLDVAVPSWRPDVQGPADLVEEIARIASLSRLEGRPLRRPAGVARPILTPMQRREAQARRRIAALGYNECVTYSFIDREAAAAFGGGQEATRLENPISSEMSHLRPDLLPGLLRAAARNQARGFADLALFEVGQSFAGGEPGEQARIAAGIRIGATAPRDAHGSRRPVDLHDARADAEAVLAAIGAPARTTLRRGAPGWFHPGRSGVITLGPKTVLAAFGELHPRVLATLDLRGPAVAIAIQLEALPFPKTRTATRPPLVASDFQAVERDFAFVLDAEVEAGEVVKAARSADKALIDGVTVFDVFSGPRAEAQFGAGRKSLAIAVRMQPTEATLTDREIEAVSARIVAAVETATGGSLRT